MKRLLQTIFILSIISSCAKNATEDESMDSSRLQTVLGISSVDTRTSFGEEKNDTYPILWNNGDKLSVNGHESRPIELESASTSATIVVDGVVQAPYSVLYPSSALTSEGKVRFPSTQVYESTQFDPEAQIMMGYSSSTQVSMNISTAFIRVTIRKGGDEEKLRSIRLYTYDGTPISGVYTPDFEHNTLEYCSSGSNCITLTSSNGIEYTNDVADAVFAVPTGEYNSGFAIAAIGVSSSNVYQMGRRVADFTSSHTTTLEAGKIYPLKEVTFADDGLTFSGGNGTVESPYKIATAEDLMVLSEVTNGSAKNSYLGCSYIQMADISMKGFTWTPIAASTAFTGTYDGQNHYIGDLQYDAVDGYPSFIAYSSGATIKDIKFGTLDGETYDGVSRITLDKLTGSSWLFMGLFADIKDCHISGIENYIPFEVKSTADAKVCLAAICSGVRGKSTIENCTNYARIEDNNGDTAYKQNVIGGCFGSIYTTTGTTVISKCHNYGVVHAETGSCQFVGGILGKVETTGVLTIEECTNHANVENVSTNGYSKKYIHIGGIMGAAGNTTTISKCTNEADISGSTSPYHQTLGGILGYPQKTTLTECVNNGDISSDSPSTSVEVSTGGIFGWSQSTNTVKECVNNGNLFVRRKQGARSGGIAGTTEYTDIVSCTNNGTVTADQSATTGAYFQSIGGIVGYVRKNNTTNYVTDCINKGNVVMQSAVSGTETTPTCAGGVFGRIDPVGKYNNNTCLKSKVEATCTGSAPCYAGGVVGVDQTTAVTEMSGNYTRNATISASGQSAAAGGILGASLISTAISSNYSLNTTVSCNTGKGGGCVVGYNTSTIDSTTVSGTVNDTALTAENYTSYQYGTNEGTVSNTVFSTFEDYEFSGGTGTASDPYIISTTQDLEKLSSLTSGASASVYAPLHYSQSCDIDMDGVAWQPIASMATPFSGSYEGGSHCIYNLTLAAVDGHPSFISATKNATVRNVVFGSKNGNTYDGKSYISLGSKNDTASRTYMGLVAYAENSTILNVVNYIPFTVLDSAVAQVAMGSIVGGLTGSSKVDSCSNLAKVEDHNGDTAYVQNIAGGIVGFVFSSGDGEASIVNCSNSGTVSATTPSCNHMGGIVGRVETAVDTAGKLSMTECSNSANVLNTASTSYSKCYIHIGGICGSCANSTFDTCTNTADLKDTTAPMHQTYAGIVAYPQKTTLTSCRNTGNITSSTENTAITLSIGGIAGWTQNTNTIDKCTNEGKIYGRRNQVLRCGGIAGTAEYTDVTSCTNSGSVTVDQKNTANAYWQVAGGIVGFVSKNNDDNGVTECTNTADVTLTASLSSTKASDLVSAGGIVAVIAPAGKYSSNISSEAKVSSSNTGTSACYAGGVYGLDYTKAVTEMKGNISNHMTVEATGTASAAGGFIGGNTISTVATDNSSFSSTVTSQGSYGAGAVVGNNTKSISNTSISGTVNGTPLTAENFESYAAGTNSGTISGTTFAESVKYSFSGGSGTASDPFIIGTAEDLHQLGALTNNSNAFSYNARHYAMNSDIDMNGTQFTSVCTLRQIPFRGSFDGRGYRILNLQSTGGVFGIVDGGEVSGIELKDATIGGTEATGAICNLCTGGSISACKVVGGSTVSSTGGDAGGIVGKIEAADDILIDGCEVLAPVSGLGNIGGIAGHSVSSEHAVGITNCVYAGASLTSTGSDEGFSNEGGMVGLVENNSGNAGHSILNCTSILPKVTYPASSTPCVGGILGKVVGQIGNSSVEGCWSTFQLCYLWRDDYNMTKAINNNDSSDTATYGAIVGSCPSNLRFRYCFWFDSTKMGPSTLTDMETCKYAGPIASLKDKLANFVSTYTGKYTVRNWSDDSRGYPVPGNLTTDNPGHNQLRVSVIGASVSTFRSWITIGNAVYYYEGRDGFDVNYDDTYWNRLTNNYLTNARIEKNIAWSGSCMASCDNQATKPSFVTRYNTHGIGSPDIIILAGPANESSRNKSGTKVDATSGYAYNEEVPDSAMDKLYATPVDELDEQYFLDATVKLVQKLHAAHPKAILVLEIYDYYLTVQMEHGIAKIGNHYDYVTLVDFYADGYNNIPKYSGHPLAAGHEKMANKIYNAIKGDL